MGYRDDREALRQMVETLEAELARAQRELAETAEQLGEHESKDVEDEARIEALREEVESLRRKLGISSTPARESKKTERLVIGGIVAAIMALGGVVFAVLVEEGAPAETVSVEIPKPEASAVPPPPPPSAPPPPPVVATVSFGAVVLEAEGTSLEPGDGCLLQADLREGPSVAVLRLRCGEALLYDSTDPLGAGMEMRAEAVQEALVAGGAVVYGLTYQDHGMRSGPRAQLSLDSSAQTLRVWSETGRAFAVSLYVRDRSFERWGTPLAAGTMALLAESGRPLTARASTRHRTGPVPSFIGDECELHAHAHVGGSDFDCRVVLRCGHEIVYGKASAGFNDCTFTRGVPATADDSGATMEDGDPRLSFDRERRRLVVSDDRGADEWRVELRLEPTSVDSLRGSWDGFIRAEGDEPLPATLEVNRRGGAVLRRAEGSESELVVWLVDSPGDRPEGATEFQFGPGFATLYGRTEAGDVIELMRR